MKKFEVIWQRLVDEKGETCDRCDKTYLNLEYVIKKLEPLFNGMGIEVDFQKKALSLDEFKRNPLSSNEIIINGKKIEDILNLKVGQSCCCGPCGDSECRTVIDETGEKEVIDKRLIIKAILREIIKIL